VAEHDEPRVPTHRVHLRACDDDPAGRHVEQTIRVSGHIADVMIEEYQLAIARRFEREHGTWPDRVGVGVVPWVAELDEDAA
jgi:hypothetical protein